MKLAILMTNTDVSGFADQHPKDGDKFSKLIHLVRPDWPCTVFDTTQSKLPEGIDLFDGFLITGSPASVHDDEDWIAELSHFIKDIHDQNLPIFGACFGHQLIAKSLGGGVGRNPQGWVLGVADSNIVEPKDWMSKLPAKFPLYAAHIEQVLSLPPGAEVVAISDGCPNAGYVLGETVYTTQYHPEMTSHFIEALVEHLSGDLNEDVIKKAKTSLSNIVEMAIFAESIAQFFENSIQK